MVQSKATAGKQYSYTRYDVTGRDLHCVPPYYSLAVTYLKVHFNLARTVNYQW